MSKDLNKLFRGLTQQHAKQRLLEIFGAAHEGENFDDKFPEIWGWMQTYYHLRAHNETFYDAVQAFQEKLDRLRKQMHNLEEIIRKQRAELKKLQPQSDHGNKGSG